MRATIYYGFLGGVYHESRAIVAVTGEEAPSYFKQTYGYLIILCLSLVERICLFWLENRFGCTDEVFQQILKMEAKLKGLRARILKLA